MNKSRIKEIKTYLKLNNVDITTPEGKKAYKVCKKLFTSKEFKTFKDK